VGGGGVAGQAGRAASDQSLFYTIYTPRIYDIFFFLQKSDTFTKVSVRFTRVIPLIII